MPPRKPNQQRQVARVYAGLAAVLAGHGAALVRGALIGLAAMCDAATFKGQGEAQKAAYGEMVANLAAHYVPPAAWPLMTAVAGCLVELPFSPPPAAGEAPAELRGQLAEAADIMGLSPEYVEEWLTLWLPDDDRPQGTALALFEGTLYEPFASAPVVLAPMYALMFPRQWQHLEDYGLSFTKDFSLGRYVICCLVYDPGRFVPSALAGLAAEQIVQQFSLQTARLHLLFAAYAARLRDPHRDSFTLSGWEQLGTLGRRKDVSRQDQLWQLAKDAEIIGSIKLVVEWHQGKFWAAPLSWLWQVGEILPYGQLALFGRPRNLTDVLIRNVRPGDWHKTFLNRDRSAGMRQIGYLAEHVLGFDPYHQRLAARLALHLTVMVPQRDLADGLTVRKLLEGSAGAAELAAARRDRHRRQNLVEQLDHALLAMRREGWWFGIDLQTYPILSVLRLTALPEEDPAPAPFPERPRGYFDTLLSAKIAIAPPVYMPPPRPPRGPRPLGRARPQALTGDEWQSARERRGWSRRELADLAGCKRAMIGHIETGFRQPGRALNRKLRHLLDLLP